MLVSKCKNKIKVGQKVRTNGSTSFLISKYLISGLFVEGIIGEIQEEKFYIWQNTHSGSDGKIKRDEKYNFSWLIYFNNKKATIKILDSMDSIKSIKELNNICLKKKNSK